MGVPRALKNPALTSSLRNRRRSEIGRDVPFGGDDLCRAATEEEIADDAGALHAGKRFDLLEHAVVKVGPLRGRYGGRRGE